MKRKNILTVSALGMLLAGLLLPKPVSAFWPFSNNNTGSTFPPLIQKIIDKFKLNSDEVKKVVDEERTARQKEMQKKYEEWLDILVKAGKINETQKQAILKKHAELQEKRQAKWQTRANQRQELEKWAKENNIDISYLFGMGGWGGRKGGWH